MSKIRHWNERLQSWEIDGASNAANIELTNPGFLDENGNSISVDLGFTKLDNRMNKLERNLAWIYQNGAKGGGGGGGGGGTIDSTEYTISVEEGNRVYTAGTSVTIHLTINGGSLRKIFLVEITNALTGERLASPVVTGLTRTEIVINGLSESTQVLKISAHTGLYYASDFILTVVAGAIKLSRTRVPPSLIYPTTVVTPAVFQVANSTDSDLKVIVTYTTDEINYNTLTEIDVEKTSSNILDLIIPEISDFLTSLAQVNVGVTYTFNVYALGVLNDTLLKSNVIVFNTAVILPKTLYILTYGVNRSTPELISDLSILNLFVYGQSVLFDYELTYSDNNYPIYNIEYTVTPCYFESGVLVTDIYNSISGEVNRVIKGTPSIFSFSTASLPIDTIYDTENNLYKFIKVTITATSNEDSRITDTKILYFTLRRAVEKYITATNFDRSLICYYSPVMGVPTGNINIWRYDNLNTQFPYSRLGIVQLRYIDLVGYNVNGLRNGFSTQGIHLTGKSYALLGLNLFSSQSNEVNLLNGNGFTISTTFKTDANIDENSVVMSLGKYKDNTMVAGIEITASLVKVVVNGQGTALSITKGDLTTIDIVLERYVGKGDSWDSPTHWFVKIFLNGVLSSLGSYENTSFTTTSLGTAGWYFDDYLCLGARIENDNVISSADTHFYDLKVYSTALSDNEITLNYISSTIYSELENGSNPSLTLLNELLSKNFILMNTEGEYESLLFDTVDVRQYKDDNTLLSTLRAALADSKIPYPIVVINQLTANSNFYGTTQAQFSEDLKAIVTGEEYRYPINMDYYTMGNATATRISNQEKMLISIQGTSSLQFVSKNYEIYMGSDDTNKPVLVLMREDWLPENEYTLKADVMDSAHVNNVLIGRIINGMVTTTDVSGQEVAVKPLDNTPPMNTINLWASKIKHTSEGYPVILFINFRNSDGSTITKCLGIYNFNLGRAASFNLGLKLLNSCTFVDNSATFPRMVNTYSESTTIVNNSPVYSIEVGENNLQIGAFDLDDPNILTSGIFDTIYASDGKASEHLLSLLTFLAGFGWNIQNPKKVLVDGLWCTPRVVKNGAAWLELGYYLPANPADYVQSTLELHMNWNNLIAYYVIAIVFGLVDSMGKNLTLRTWNMINDENGTPLCVWYMCFYDMDTAMRLDNDGNESVPYNAHLNRYYTDNSGVFSEAKIDYHTASIVGLFTLSYSMYNTRLQEIAENLKDISKSLSDVYVQLRNNLFPDPGQFIDKYYTGQINQIGAALYNYDYKLKYLLTKKTYSVQTGELTGTNDYNQISYLHGNGATNIKSWFKKRIRFLDGIYGADTSGNNLLINNNLTDVTLSELWANNQAIKNLEDPTVIQLTLSSESLTFINITMGTATKTIFWIDEVPTVYKIRNVSALQRISIYGNKVLTTLDGFNKFRWTALNSIDFPLVKSLSLKGAVNINAGAFVLLGNIQETVGLQSLRELDLSGVLLNLDSNIVYASLEYVKNLPSLEWLDISNSSFNNVGLPLSGVLRYLNMSNTKISKIEFQGLPLLEELLLDGCNDLESITLVNCPKLRTLNVPSSVREIILTNCPGLEELTCTFSGRLVSNLENITVAGCEGLKYFNIRGLNNPILKVDLLGATGLETIDLSNIVTDNIEFSDNWTSLKYLNISNTSIGALNYKGTISTVLDLRRHTNLETIIATNNYSVSEILCPNIENKFITLTGSAFSECSGLTRLIGNFLINGTRVFLGCSGLVLNTNYSGVVYTDDYIPGQFCNLSFDDNLSSYSEMFAGCSSITGLDFRYIMSKVKENVVNLNKMFYGCASINVQIWNDLFRNCPNVIDITSFCESSGITGTFYSTTQSRTGILDYLPNLRIANYAFANTGLTWIDNNVFKDNTSITEADYMFSNCYNLQSCDSTDSPALGYLHSKTFFMNLSNLTNVLPSGMFQGCLFIKMTVDSEEVDGIMFDYLFHYPNSREYNSTTLTNSLYTGVKLVGTIHANVFGGILRTDGTYNIPLFTVISGPFSNSGGELIADLYELEDIFKNLNPTSLVNALSGIDFSLGSEIPSNIFKGCSELRNLTGFFSNSTITNNGNTYEFPNLILFKDCTKLLNVSLLFYGDTNLNIKLLGEGFLHNPLTDVSLMLQNTGVFGSIPYKFLRTTGKTITKLNNIFKGCFKLGYTRDRSLSIGDVYYRNGNAYTTTWDDIIIENQGTPVLFELDYSSQDNADSLYIDGRPWPTAWQSLSVFDSEVYEQDLKQLVALDNSLGRANGGYQNYMFPADLFYSCADECDFKDALNGLSYTTNILVPDEEGLISKEEGLTDGLKGRLPMKLFYNNSGITSIKNLFEGLNFCPFIAFSSYIYDTQRLGATHARGIKLPIDLFRYTPNITSLNNTFKSIEIEEGIDMNLNLSYLPRLISISGLLSNIQFHDSPVSGDILRLDDEDTYLSGVLITYPQVAADTFVNNHELRDISSLFEVPNLMTSTKGLLHVSSSMFLPEDSLVHPYLSNVSNVFYNNTLLAGTIPLMLGSYITLWQGYIEGVNKNNISNANDYTSVHTDLSWWPSSWRTDQ